MRFYEECKWVDGKPTNATLSAGVALARPGFTIDDLLAAADQALYAAKASGRNRVRHFQDRTDDDGPIAHPLFLAPRLGQRRTDQRHRIGAGPIGRAFDDTEDAPDLIKQNGGR